MVKLDREIKPIPMQTPQVKQPPMGRASEPAAGLLKPSGALVPSPAGRTQSQGVATFVGKPTSNRG